MARKKIKVVMSKLGIDGHDRGMLVVSKALRDAGMEVVYLGTTGRTIEDIVRVSVQEDVDVVGVNSYGDAHLILAPKLVQRLKEQGLGHVLVILGGLVPDEDIPMMKEAGISEVFGELSKLDDIVKYIEEKTSGHDP
ncbi:cobalamin B12-binding domain-containing protein, partial [Chloroflexota bacterium]